ncbi:MAG TPA: hypothetical protein VH518_14530 [Tepidisphaeraceae bacterium]|jgi:hypothetical protein
MKLRILAAVSLVLGLAIIIAWIHGVRSMDYAVFTSDGRRLAISSTQGSVLLEWDTAFPGYTHYDRHQFRVGSVPFGYFPNDGSAELCGPQVQPPVICDWAAWTEPDFRGRNMERQRHGVVRNWVLLLLSSVAPAFCVIRRLRGSCGVGLCKSCGYDLRATPDRCPECGTAAILPIPPAHH